MRRGATITELPHTAFSISLRARAGTGGSPAADRNGGGGRLGGGTPGTASGGLRVSPVALRVDADFADAGGAAAESRGVGGDAAGRCATPCLPPAGTRCGATGGLAARDGERAGAAGGGDRAPLLCEMGLLAHPSVGADSPRVPADAVDFSVPGSGGGIGVADAPARRVDGARGFGSRVDRRRGWAGRQGRVLRALVGGHLCGGARPGGPTGQLHGVAGGGLRQVGGVFRGGVFLSLIHI